MDIASNVAASLMTAQQRTMDVIANNFANANTPGYKAEHVQFSDWLSRQHNTAAPPGGRTVAYTQDRATWRDMHAGNLTHTGNPLDLALTGEGYFTVNTPRGPRLTRDGRFSLLANGTIADSTGAAVLDTTGKPIQLAPTDTRITVAGDGTISSENGALGQIGIVQPNDAMRLTGEGSTQFRADTPTAPVTTPKIVQGAVEDSNVQPVLEMTRMLDNQQQFQFLAQFMQAESDRQQQAIDKILPSATSS